MTRHTLAAVLLIAAGSGMAHAADKITWDELGKRVRAASAAYDRIQVITKDGRTHRPWQVAVDADQMKLYGRGSQVEILRRADVARVRVKRRAGGAKEIPILWLFAAGILTGAPWESSYALPRAVILGPLTVGFAAVATPALFVDELIRFCTPAKVYEVKSQ